MRLNRCQLANALVQRSAQRSSVVRSTAPRGITKNCVDHSGGKAMARLFCEFHALIDGGVGGNAVEKLQLESAEAEGDEDFRIEPRVGTLEQGANLLIEPDLPAK